MDYFLGKEIENINRKLDLIISVITEEIEEEDEENTIEDKNDKKKVKEYEQNI